jgi:hypothetical protein
MAISTAGENPFNAVIKRRAEISAQWAKRVFATSSTFRMFDGGQSAKMRELLVKEIGDGSRLAKAKNEREYSRTLRHTIRRFQRRFKMNRNASRRPPGFGQAAKVVDLYVKALTQLPSRLLPHKIRLEKYAHVALDNVVMGHMWGSARRPGLFKEAMKGKGFHRRPKLSKLTREDYSTLQQVVANAARQQGLSPILYDYIWALRDN